jgi:hypothetical protein
MTRQIASILLLAFFVCCPSGNLRSMDNGPPKMEPDLKLIAEVCNAKRSEIICGECTFIYSPLIKSSKSSDIVDEQILISAIAACKTDNASTFFSSLQSGGMQKLRQNKGRLVFEGKKFRQELWDGVYLFDGTQTIDYEKSNKELRIESDLGNLGAISIKDLRMVGAVSDKMKPNKMENIPDQGIKLYYNTGDIIINQDGLVDYMHTVVKGKTKKKVWQLGRLNCAPKVLMPQTIVHADYNSAGELSLIRIFYIESGRFNYEIPAKEFTTSVEKNVAVYDKRGGVANPSPVFTGEKIDDALEYPRVISKPDRGQVIPQDRTRDRSFLIGSVLVLSAIACILFAVFRKRRIINPS